MSGVQMLSSDLKSQTDIQGQKRRRLINTEEPSPKYRTAEGDQGSPKREPID